MSQTAPDPILDPDPTLDEVRAALAPVIPHHAAFDGWSDEALAAAAAEVGVPASVARLAFADGPAGMIDAWFAAIDRRMAATLPPERLAAMKIRARITALVMARLDTAAPDREALRRAIAILALPSNAARGLRLGWRAADAMWHLAGDTATDIAHYTKRATLGGVYAATMLVFLDDESEDYADTRAFLDRRISGIMRFEKLKGQLRPDPDRIFSPARLLGRLRYRVT
ncbi:COQ9 family protein [Sphingomonas solaris]|uniref:COQ9 family protein n=1 Tax=Alterirhizorhabdus solaris TaxID=2529389 RepID=A0A558R8G8_9SPHN|nr:COQ9 family protein [Sphingomonas solaris]TVV75656.1 COQ9 family protein [Sphingomonas solaris]